MLFEKLDAMLDIDMSYLAEIIRAIDEKTPAERQAILGEMVKGISEFRKAMTLMSTIIEKEDQPLYKESFEAALRCAGNPTDVLEIYYLVRRNNFSEGRMALDRFDEMLKLELRETKLPVEKTEKLADLILKMEKDDELAENNFPVLMSMMVPIKDFRIWYKVYMCAIKHEYGQEAIRAVEKMWGWDLKQRELPENIILCACLTLFDIRRTDQLLCEIKEEIERTCKHENEKIAEWIKVLIGSPAGSRMELYAAKNLAGCISAFNHFSSAMGFAKSGKARRIIARRGLEIAGGVTELKTVATYANSYPEIFGSALDKMNALPDSISKYFAIFGLGKEWREFAFEKMKGMEPANEQEAETYNYVKGKMLKNQI